MSEKSDPFLLTTVQTYRADAAKRSILAWGTGPQFGSAMTCVLASFECRTAIVIRPTAALPNTPTGKTPG
jgi:hypothetical protein